MIMAVFTRPSLLSLCVLVILGELGGVRAQLTFNAGTVTIAENSPTDTTVKTLTATGGTSTYTYTFVGTTDQFKIATDEVQVKAGAVLNFEAGSSIEVAIKVEDGANPPLSATSTLTVTLTDVNENPSFAEASYPVSMKDGAGAGTVVGNFTATDPDTSPNGIDSYSIQDGNTGNVFENTNGEIKVAAGKSLDASSLPAYILTFRATDGAGSPLTADTKVNIAVVPVCSGVSSVDANLATMVAGVVILMTKRFF